MKKRNSFRKLKKQKSEGMAFKALLNKKATGRKTLRYGDKLQMADYLCPNSVEEQMQFFQIRRRVNSLPANKGEVSHC